MVHCPYSNCITVEHPAYLSMLKPSIVFISRDNIVAILTLIRVAALLRFSKRNFRTESDQLCISRCSINFVAYKLLSPTFSVKFTHRMFELRIQSPLKFNETKRNQQISTNSLLYRCATLIVLQIASKFSESARDSVTQSTPCEVKTSDAF